MKIRIQGNSLRLRLSQREVALLRDRGRIESCIEFAPDCRLVYLLETSFRARAVTASLDGCAIRVTAPTHVIAEWAESQQVSIETTSASGLQLLIEKDFQCLHKADPQDIDAYPHPLDVLTLDAESRNL
jgi:hypothetical protein